jgi:Inner membrane protein YgaP-like, transmembrane domain
VGDPHTLGALEPRPEARNEHTRRKRTMKINEYLRAIAGAFVLASLALGHWVSPYFYLLTAFVGLNLVQSSFTRWCPMMSLLRALHVQE